VQGLRSVTACRRRAGRTRPGQTRRGVDCEAGIGGASVDVVLAQRARGRSYSQAWCIPRRFGCPCAWAPVVAASSGWAGAQWVAGGTTASLCARPSSSLCARVGGARHSGHFGRSGCSLGGCGTAARASGWALATGSRGGRAGLAGTKQHLRPNQRYSCRRRIG
jgi:hypothetical protein